jgi:cytochrome bd-type quinol oxidase subunit 2
MKWFPIARVGVIFTFITGIYLHLSRLVFGIDLTLERLVTTAFDSIFAVVLIFVTWSIFAAREEVELPGRLQKALYYFTLVYMAISVPVHVRTWFVPDNPQALRMFPEWYSAFFLCFTSVLIAGWWKLRAKPLTDSHPA